MCTIYGDCRISRRTQNIERQVRNIKAAYPDAVIIREAFTGTKMTGRVEFERLLKRVQPGDTIVFDSVSRMSRNAEEGFALYLQLFLQGVELVFLKEPHINTATYKQAMDRQIAMDVQSGDEDADRMFAAITESINAYMMKLAERQIRLAFEQAEKEVQDLHQRTREGIQTAKLNGKQIGAVEGRKLNVKKAAPAKEKILAYSRDFNGTLSDKDAMKLIGIASNTYYKYKREIRESMVQAVEE